MTKEKLTEIQLGQSKNLASLSLFVSGIAHELGNLNNCLTFNIPILRDYLKELIPILDDYAKRQQDFEMLGMSYPKFREDVFRILDSIEHASDRIVETGSGLREFIKMASQEERRSVDVAKVIKKSVAVCRGKIRMKVKSFEINIDPDQRIYELYEDNNFYSIPFYVKPDTTTPTITLTIDGNDILDGEYISPNPEIHIELNDQSLLPIIEPNSVMVYLNEELIPSDTSIIIYQFSENNPKVSVDFTPTLPDGEYELRVLWRDYNGEIVDSSGVVKYFLVSNEAKILNVYNYPNPTSGETHFTFKLTQIPEEIKIKIFTIAGRLVKEIKLTSTGLKFDFNKIYWNGRDEEGDILANGVYLYKVIMKAGDKTEDVIQKLAIVR